MSTTAVCSHPPSASQLREQLPSPSTELFDLLTSDGRPTGQTKLRSLVHRDGDWHRAVHIWLIHTGRRQVLIQRRAACKDSWPSHWDVGCAGHLSAGEDSLTAARAELAEELGITLHTDSTDSTEQGRLTHVDSIRREVISQQGRFIDREWTDVYLLLGQYEIDQMRLQKEEVEAVRYVDVDEYVAQLRDGAPGYVSFPDLPDYQRRVFDVIKWTLQQVSESEAIQH